MIFSFDENFDTLNGSDEFQPLKCNEFSRTVWHQYLRTSPLLSRELVLAVIARIGLIHKLPLYEDAYWSAHNAIMQCLFYISHDIHQRLLFNDAVERRVYEEKAAASTSQAVSVNSRRYQQPVKKSKIVVPPYVPHGPDRCRQRHNKACRTNGSQQVPFAESSAKVLKAASRAGMIPAACTPTGSGSNHNGSEEKAGGPQQTDEASKSSTGVTTSLTQTDTTIAVVLMASSDTAVLSPPNSTLGHHESFTSPSPPAETSRAQSSTNEVVSASSTSHGALVAGVSSTAAGTPSTSHGALVAGVSSTAAGTSSTSHGALVAGVSSTVAGTSSTSHGALAAGVSSTAAGTSSTSHGALVAGVSSTAAGTSTLISLQPETSDTKPPPPPPHIISSSASSMITSPSQDIPPAADNDDS